MNLLIVDDQRGARRVLRTLLELLPDVHIHEASTAEEACARLREDMDIAFIDLCLSSNDGQQGGLPVILEARRRDTLPIVVSGSGDMDDIRAAMRQGAHGYILKGELCEELVLPMVEDQRQRRALQREVASLRGRRAPDAAATLIGTSAPMRELRDLIHRVALSDRPLLVLGPTGAGKELVVRAIHALGPNPQAPLLDVNCGAIPESLMESQLFGHERGAFTGAGARHEGFCGAVADGTLFLDEIAELPLGLQAKLLRVLETGRFRPVGAAQDQPLRGRVVAATHTDIGKLAQAGRFREDLYYRLNVLGLRVPSLAERSEDIPALCAHFAARQPRPLRFSEDAIEALRQRPFPGNVRELRNLIDRLCVFCQDDPITAASLRGEIAGGAAPQPPGEDELRRLARQVLRLHLPNKIEGMTRWLLAEAMDLAGGNKTAAARLLGVHRKYIERRVSQPREGEEE